MEVTGKGRAKLLLFGEHAAVQGFPAVGFTLPWDINVGITISGEKIWNLEPVEPLFREGVKMLLEKAEKIFPAASCRGRVQIESGIPEGAGFGSSAALCIALVEALMQMYRLPDRYFYGSEQENRFKWETAHEMEKVFHGTPSGIDTGLSGGRGMYSFLPAGSGIGLPERQCIAAPPLFLVVGAVKRTENARNLILDLGNRFHSGEAAVVSLIQELGSLAEKAVQLLRYSPAGSGAPVKLGELATHAQQILERLNLSTPEIERLLKKGISFGSTGGKVSGAGGGGAFFLFAESEKRAGRIAGELADFCIAEGIETVSPPVPISLAP